MSQYISVTSKNNLIYDVGYDSKGKKYYKNVKYKPHCFIESSISNTNVKTIYGERTKEIIFDTLKDYQQFVFKNKNISHGTIDPCIQYIRSNYNDDLNMSLNITFFDIEVYSESEFPLPNETKYPINSLSIYSTKNKIYYLLSLKDYDKHKNTINIDPEKINFKFCKTEQELLETFIKIIKYEKSDILSGWNSSQFDIPYCINRMSMILGKDEANNLSPFKNVYTKIIKKKNKVTNNYEDYYINKIDGIVLLDYMELYKKYILDPRESYSLDFIAKTELGEGKVDYSEFDNLRSLWINSPQLYSDYNIVDSKLLKELEDNLKLVELHSVITYKSKCNFTDAMSPVKLWESYLYNEMLNRNVCLPVRRKYEDQSFPGAFVIEPVPGYYENIVTFDLESLYPSINIQFNLALEKMKSQEEYKQYSLSIVKDHNIIKYLNNDFNKEIDKICVDYLVDNELSTNLKTLLKITNHTITPNKYFWDVKKESTTGSVLKNLFDERKQIKRNMLNLEQELIYDKDENKKAEHKRLDYKQKAIKTMMNSYYGITGNIHFILYHLQIATATTTTAQLASKYIEKYTLKHDKLKKFDIYCITGDTDSRFFCLDNIIKKLVSNNIIKNDVQDKINFMNKFSLERIQPIIKEGYEKLSQDFNVIENRLVMKLEKTCSSGIFLAKKRYALNVFCNEGVVYDKPKIKITGIQVVQSSTPTSIKPFLRNIIKNILEQQDIIQYVKQCKKEYMQFDVEKLAFPRSANNFEKWVINNEFQKGIPIAVRSALVYNKYIDDNKLEKQFSKIQSGDKLYFLYLKMPNPTQENVFGFIRKFPKEMKKYVDKDMMFELSFMNPVKGICEKIGVDYKEKQKSVNDLF